MTLLAAVTIFTLSFLALGLGSFLVGRQPQTTCGEPGGCACKDSCED